MADDTELPPFPGDASGHLRPGLIQAYGQEAPQDQGYAADAANKVQDYLTGRAIANQAEAAGNQFVNDLAGTRANLSNMVRVDPHATDLALSLVPGAVDSLTAHHGDEDERAAAASSITDHIRNEIAIAGIQAHAGISQAAGHAAIDKWGTHLGDGEDAVLRTYTDNMETLRQADASAAQIARARQLVEGSNRNTVGWLNQLHDPTTGAVMFPPGWGQRMMQDHSLAPDARQGLLQAYTRLQQNGDAEASDPSLVSDFLRRAAGNPYHSPKHPMPPEIIRHVGGGIDPEDSFRYRAYRGMAGGDQVLDANGNPKTPARPGMSDIGILAGQRPPPAETGDPVLRGNQPLPPDPRDNPDISDYDWVGAGHGVGGQPRALTMSDAQFLASRTGPQSPQMRDETHQLATAYDTAREQIGNQAAFQRFSNWFLPAYRNATSGGQLGPADLLNPASPSYLLNPERMARFRPTGDDLIAPAVASLGAAPRQSLGDIFGGIGRAISAASSAGLDIHRRARDGEMLQDPMGGVKTLGVLFGGAGATAATAAGEAVNPPEPMLRTNDGKAFDLSGA
jgi:hypothetical protein